MPSAPKVPAAVQTEVLARQKDIAAGKLPPFPRQGRSARQREGKVAIAAGQTLSDDQILGANWLAEGVVGKLVR